MITRAKDEWYTVKQDDIRSTGGQGLLAVYSHSYIKMLKKIYPDYPWKPWKFNRVSRGIFSIPIMYYLSILSPYLSILSLHFVCSVHWINNINNTYILY